MTTAFLFLELFKSIKPLFLHQDCVKSRLIKNQDYSKILLVRDKMRERESKQEREEGRKGEGREGDIEYLVLNPVCDLPPALYTGSHPLVLSQTRSHEAPSEGGQK